MLKETYDISTFTDFSNHIRIRGGRVRGKLLPNKSKNNIPYILDVFAIKYCRSKLQLFTYLKTLRNGIIK